MKHYFAAACIFLVSIWNAVLVAGFLHDANQTLEPTANYFWGVFLYATLAAIGVVATIMLMCRARMAPTFLTLWIMATAVAVGFVVGNFFSFAGKDSFPAVLLNIPQLAVGILVAILLSPGATYKPLGMTWPVVFVALLVVAIAVHTQIKPAEHRVERNMDFVPAYELWIPRDSLFYLRPFSVSVAMIGWTIMCIRPFLREGLPLRATSDPVRGDSVPQ